MGAAEQILEYPKHPKIDCQALKQNIQISVEHEYLRLFGHAFRRSTALTEPSCRERIFDLLNFHLQSFVGRCFATNDEKCLSGSYVINFLDFLKQIFAGVDRTSREGLRDRMLEALQYAGRVSDKAYDDQAFHVLLQLWMIFRELLAADDDSAVRRSIEHLLFWDLVAVFCESRSRCDCFEAALVDIAASRSLWQEIVKKENEDVFISGGEWTLMPQSCRELSNAVKLELVAYLLEHGVDLEPNATLCRSLVNTTLPKSVSKTLNCARSLIKRWKHSAVEIFMPILDFFLMHLDDPMEGDASGIGRYFEDGVSAKQLLSICEMVCDKSHGRHQQPFHECLALMASILKDAGTGALRQISGRIYVKLSRSKVLTFSTRGTVNFTLLQLVVSRFSENQTEALKRYCERCVPPVELPITSSRLQLLCACLSSFQLLNNRLGKKTDFDSVLEFVQKRLRNESKIHAGDVVPQLLDAVEELAMASAFSQGFCFCPAWRYLFDESPPSLQVSIMTTFSGVIDNYRSQRCDSRAFVDSSEETIHHMVATSLRSKPRFSTGHDLFCAADLQADFVLILGTNDMRRMAFEKRVVQHTAKQPAFVARALARLVRKDGVAFEDLIASLDDRAALILKLIFNIRSPCGDMDTLIAATLRLNLEPLVPNRRFEGDYVLQFEDLVQSWTARYHRLLSSGDHGSATRFRMSIRALLGDLKFDPKAMTEFPANQILHIFKVAGILFANGSPLLYTKGIADCPLPHLLECFVYPKSLLRDGKTALPKAFIEGMRCQGHLFLQGLDDLRKDDSLISRKFSEVIAYYGKLFPQGTPIANFMMRISKNSPTSVQLTITSLWTSDLSRSALIDLFSALVTRCSDSFVQAIEIKNFHMQLLVKLLEVSNSVLIEKFYRLIEMCAVPVGVHCPAETSVVLPSVLAALGAMDLTRKLRLLDTIANGWPELTSCALQTIKLTANTDDQRNLLAGIERKLRSF